MPNDIKFTQFVSWAFQSLILAVGAWGVSELSSLSNSVQELNIKMAVVVERDATRHSEITMLRSRVDRLESKKN